MRQKDSLFLTAKIDAQREKEEESVPVQCYQTIPIEGECAVFSAQFLLYTNELSTLLRGLF